MGYLGVVSASYPHPGDHRAIDFCCGQERPDGRGAETGTGRGQVHYSAMTGQSLFYLGETDLKHKVLGISEEEGVRQAAYALKLLQSQGN